MEEATAGFEPAIGVLQTPALPLGYVAKAACTPHKPVWQVSASYQEQFVLSIFGGLAVVVKAEETRLQDETRYCERCGISFIYSSEEQRGDYAAGRSAPTHCAGCRVLLPPHGRERGMVKWYSPRKRYGFVVRQNQGELFLPASSLQGRIAPQPGDLVEFSVGENERGAIAVDVQVLL